MRNTKYLVTTMIITAFCFVLTGCGGAKTPKSLAFQSEGYVFSGEEETLNLVEEVKAEGEDTSKEFVFTSSDESVAVISEDGILTTKQEGTAKVTVAAAQDENVSATTDILVYDYTGIYTGEKYIDAMGCNVRISFELGKDGNFSFYRYPMNVALEGGGQMEGMPEEGSYRVEGNQIVFTPEYFKEFSLRLSIKDNKAMLTGDTPTGGAITEMVFTQNQMEDQGEAGVYEGNGENEAGEMISYHLELENGRYQFSAQEEVISQGSYRFLDSEIEFFATEGMTFHASYNADRKVIEGTDIPTAAEEGHAGIAVTLEKK